MKYTIIGGGIGGLATALAFERKGIDYEVFERASEINEVGAGIWLSPNALQVLESIGVLEEIKKAGNSIDRITLAAKDLSALSDNPQDLFKEHFGYSTIAIHRAALQQTLFEKIPNSKKHLGKNFQSFEKLGNGTIKINFSDHSSINTDYLIGADGINSKVRNQLFPGCNKRDSGQTCWRGVADFSLDESFMHRGIEMWGGNVRFGLSAIAKNKVYWFAVAKVVDLEKDKSKFTRNDLLQSYQEFHPLVNQLISNTQNEAILLNDIGDLKPLKNWYEGNVCLIGDAAHATTPNMGQGGAQAIEDAYYLSHFVSKEEVEKAFLAFQQSRKKKVNGIVSQSWNTGKIAHWTKGVSIRNFLMRTIPAKVFEKKLMEMYTIDLFH